MDAVQLNARQVMDAIQLNARQGYGCGSIERPPRLWMRFN
jgi:hypothetical protein